MDERDVGSALKEILISAERLQARIGELAAQIDADYAGRDLLLVGVLKGAVMVMADLSRAMHLPVQMDWMAISSYGSGTKSSGVVRILKDLDTDITGRHVLIVEDIVDSGLTLSWLAGNLQSREPASLAVCAMLRKPGSAQMHVDVAYTGFDIADEFVVGYGLDYAERYRNLPFIGTLAPAVYRAARLAPRKRRGTQSAGEAFTFQVCRRSGVPSSFTVAATVEQGCEDGSKAIPPEVDGNVRLVRRERFRAEGTAHRWS